MLSLAGCMQAEKTADLAAADAKATMTAQNSPTLSMAEVQEGQVVQRQARRPAVRQLDARMVTEHGMVNDQLMALAREKKITPPVAPNDYKKNELGELKTMKGSAFDKAGLDAQVVDHQEVLRLYQMEAEQGTDPDVKAFTAHHAPTIEHHLEMVQKLGGHTPNS